MLRARSYAGGTPRVPVLSSCRPKNPLLFADGHVQTQERGVPASDHVEVYRIIPDQFGIGEDVVHFGGFSVHNY